MLETLRRTRAGVIADRRTAIRQEVNSKLESCLDEGRKFQEEKQAYMETSFCLFGVFWKINTKYQLRDGKRISSLRHVWMRKIYRVP